MRLLDLFSCAGGATTGISLLDRHVVGIDHDADACATHLAAGHPTIRADLAAPVPVTGPFELLWASPPCTAFSMAGKGAGRDVSDVLIGRILAENWEPLAGLDPSVWLVLPTMAALLDLRPVAVAMENVPPTLPVMHACARALERHGYRTAVGVLSAERFGVAQTRKRAFLIANRERTVFMPEPTHQGYGDEVDEAQGSLFGDPLLPWVSMADALGWGVPSQPSPPVMTARNRQTGCDVLRGSSWRAEWFERQQQAEGNWVDRPIALDRRCQQGLKDAREAVPPVEVERPAPSMTVSGLALGQFTWKLRPDSNAKATVGSISITVAEAARLQAFPNGHPWRGSRTSVFRQIGNAVPPPVAAAVAGAALGVDWRPAVAAYLAELYSQPLEREVAA